MEKPAPRKYMMKALRKKMQVTAMRMVQVAKRMILMAQKMSE
ncbi:MAG TPA: hypothetical protein VN456_13535 [Desulfosporosinus sp.]|nr:hypothetical protein [Desulfosporosinus sp.]